MRIFVFFIASVVAFIGPVHAAVPTVDKPVAVLRMLDKVTARVEEINVRIENPYKFGTLFITVHACRITTPEEMPEEAAFLDVSEFKQGQSEVSVFRGWMFASSPALSAMEHAVYDMWLIGCKDEAVSEPSKAPENTIIMPTGDVTLPEKNEPTAPVKAAPTKTDKTPTVKKPKN